LAANNWRKAIGMAVVGAVFVGLLALAFLWPGKVAEPRNVPMAITGDDPRQVAAVSQQIEDKAEGAVKLVEVASRDQAVAKLESREVFGALILSAPAPEVLTASANGLASRMVAELAGGVAQAAMAAAAQAAPEAPPVTVETTDVVPAHSTKFDVGQLIMPLVFGGAIGGVLVSAAIAGRGQRLAALALLAVLVGCLVYLILGLWFDLLPGGFLPIAGALALAIFATGAFVAGSYALIGVPGLAGAIVITLLVSNPISGMAVPTSFLPPPWGAIGQALTIGAGGSLVRGAAYFRTGQVCLTPLLVLLAWSVLGAAAIMLKRRQPLAALASPSLMRH